MAMIFLPVHPASFTQGFCSGMQSFSFSESQDAMVLQTCHKKIVFWTHKFVVGLQWETASPRTHKPKIVNESLIWGQGHSWKSHPTDWTSQDLNHKPLIYKVSDLSTIPQPSIPMSVTRCYLRMGSSNLTCLVFTFSCFVEISGLRVKSGPKYSKYSTKTKSSTIFEWNYSKVYITQEKINFATICEFACLTQNLK